MAVAATPTAAAIPFVAGLRTTFLTEFRQDNFALIQEAKLRKRFQKENEDTASYYYDVLHMCHVINPAMTQTQILEYLYNGLRRFFGEEDLSAKTSHVRGVFGIG